MDKEAKRGGGKGVVIFAVILSIIIILGTWVFLIKTNKFFGLGEIIRPHIKDVPVVCLLLPTPPVGSASTVFSRQQLEDEYKKLITEKEQILVENEKLKQEAQSATDLQNKYGILLKEVDYLNKELELSKPQESEETLQNKKEENIQNLIKTYETMDPAESAKILEQMGTLNIDLVMQICSSMKASKFAEILQAMNTDFAAILSERMLEGN